MAGQFHVRQVLRCLDYDLLVRYFDERRPIPAVRLHVESQKEKAALWDLVPDDVRSDVEADLRRVFDLADEKGIASLHDEAAFHALDLHELIDDLDGLENKALATLLASADVFEKAATIRQADNLHGRSWRRWAGLPRGECAITQEQGRRIASAVGDFFFAKEGRGRPCDFERLLRQGRLHYVFLYPADHAHRVQVYEGGKLDTKDQRPAFDVVFTFDTLDGILSVWTTGNKDTKLALKRMFCEAVFGRDIDAIDPIATGYRLEKFLVGTDRLVIDESDGVEKVTVRKLTLAPQGRLERIAFEMAPRERHGFLDRIVGSHLRNPVTEYSVVEATVQFSLAARGSSRKPRSFTFDLHASGFSNLQNKPDEYRAIGEKYLRLWEIDAPDASA